MSRNDEEAEPLIVHREISSCVPLGAGWWASSIFPDGEVKMLGALTGKGEARSSALAASDTPRSTDVTGAAASRTEGSKAEADARHMVDSTQPKDLDWSGSLWARGNDGHGEWISKTEFDKRCRLLAPPTSSQIPEVYEIFFDWDTCADRLRPLSPAVPAVSTLPDAFEQSGWLPSLDPAEDQLEALDIFSLPAHRQEEVRTLLDRIKAVKQSIHSLMAKQAKKTTKLATLRFRGNRLLWDIACTDWSDAIQQSGDESEGEEHLQSRRDFDGRSHSEHDVEADAKDDHHADRYSLCPITGLAHELKHGGEGASLRGADNDDDTAVTPSMRTDNDEQLTSDAVAQSLAPMPEFIEQLEMGEPCSSLAQHTQELEHDLEDVLQIQDIEDQGHILRLPVLPDLSWLSQLHDPRVQFRRHGPSSGFEEW